MPRRAKFDREEIIKAAVDIIESKGVDCLTARSLGDKLGSSARPIFTVFEGMDEVAAEAYRYADELYQSYVRAGLAQPIAFKGVGEAYIRFAAEHPKLFALLFMRERADKPDVHVVLGKIEGSYSAIMQSITNAYGRDEAFAKRLYEHLWIFSHGIATLIATGLCEFGVGDISAMLSNVCRSLIKDGMKND